MSIDRLNGRPQAAYGRAIVPIVGRFCRCQHNHLAKYRQNADGSWIAYGPSAICSSCECESYRRHVAEGA